MLTRTKQRMCEDAYSHFPLDLPFMRRRVDPARNSDGSDKDVPNFCTPLKLLQS